MRYRECVTMAAAAVMMAGCGARPTSTVVAANVWAQPADASRRSAAVYVTLTAACAREDALTGVRVAAPMAGSLHASRAVEGMLRMTALPAIPLHCGAPTMLKPMGEHVMLTGLARPVRIGDRLPLVLHFRDAGEVPVEAEVTTMAVLEDVDPMGMHRGGGHTMGGMRH